MQQNVLDSIISSVKKLKPMPSNVSHIINEISKPDASIEVLTGMISLDQVLTAVTLQMSNSVMLGYSRTCSTVHDAVMHIGLKRLRSILLTSPATNMMHRSMIGYRLGAGELWHHSLVVAVAAEWLAQALHYPDPEQAYVAGLIHDIGKLLMDQAIFNNYEAIAAYVSKYQQPLWQVEEKLIGINHADLGGHIAEHWNYPVLLVDAIRFHHAPVMARANLKLPAIVNLANHLSASLQKESAGLFSLQLHPISLEILRLTPRDVETITQQMKKSGIFPQATPLERP